MYESWIYTRFQNYATGPKIARVKCKFYREVDIVKNLTFRCLLSIHMLCVFYITFRYSLGQVCLTRI